MYIDVVIVYSKTHISFEKTSEWLLLFVVPVTLHYQNHIYIYTNIKLHVLAKTYIFSRHLFASTIRISTFHFTRSTTQDEIFFSLILGDANYPDCEIFRVNCPRNMKHHEQKFSSTNQLSLRRRIADYHTKVARCGNLIFTREFISINFATRDKISSERHFDVTWWHKLRYCSLYLTRRNT